MREGVVVGVRREERKGWWERGGERKGSLRNCWSRGVRERERGVGAMETREWWERGGRGRRSVSGGRR